MLGPAELLQNAFSLFQAGKLIESESACRTSLAQAPHSIGAWQLMGLIKLAQQDPLSAIPYLERVAAALPDDEPSHTNLGVALRRSGNLEAALVHLRRATTLEPLAFVTHLNLSDALCGAGYLAEAESEANVAIAISPASAGGYQNLGTVRIKQSRYEEALALFEKALHFKPDHANAHNSSAHALMRLGRWEEGIVSARRAIVSDPNRAMAHLNLALLLLGTGHYSEGWREYEWRFAQGGSDLPLRPFTAPRWTGTPIAGASLLVHCEQGEGDTFHFIRYLPLIRSASAANRVVLECSPAAVRLLRSSPIAAGCKIVERTGWSQNHLPAFDFHHPLLSSPLVLGLLEPFSPPTGPYLHPAASAHPREKGLRIGLVWSANRENTKAAYRSVPFQEIMELTQIEGAQFVSLQYDSQETLPPGVEDATAGIRDFHDTAEVMNGLDLIITVDTSVAHLAGALDRPVWTLLSHAPDWRWGRKGSTTPWYPSMRLFRQPTTGDWTSVLREVAQELPAFIASR